MSLPSLLSPIFKANKSLDIAEFYKSLDELEFALAAIENDQKERQMIALNWTRRRSQ
ncbi:hypothetical protein [Candidatus Methanomassiliicoccus intestinalis]|uniref:hypothetical protein n=1 Tax=Candidatus Methanomassiliicoccus intestinalis TaxID=1406512 RepID=UPI00155A6706|nr:hypothetical protein [Candidatus Methanomassiliicoccus intestinalis]